MRRTYRRTLKESDFPFTVDEVLEEIESVRKIQIKAYERQAKDFKRDVIDGGFPG